MPPWPVVWAWSLALSPSFAQLPTAGALSDQDRPLFLAEVQLHVPVAYASRRSMVSAFTVAR
jgi:hypothetical protein